MVAAGLYLLIVVIAREHRALSPAIGAIFAVGAAGGILGSLMAARIHRRFPMRRLLLGITLFAVAGNNVLLAATTALFYALDPVYVVTTSSYSAATIPDALRGRVASLTRLVALAANSFGVFITGVFIRDVAPSEHTLDKFGGTG